MSDKLQVENGNFTRIVNEVLDELVKTPLLGKEFAVLLFIIRKTWGFQKKTDIISLSQIEAGTKTGRPTVVKALKNLVARNMIVKTPLLGGNISFSFNKYHEKWLVNTPKLVKGKGFPSKDLLTNTSKDLLTHKRKKKDTKEILGGETPQDTFYKEIREVIELFGLFNKNNRSWYKNTTQREDIKWLVQNYTLEKVKKAIYLTKFCFKDNFYPSISTPHELREKWVKMKKFYGSKEIKDRRFIQDFEKYMIDMEKEQDKDK